MRNIAVTIIAIGAITIGASGVMAEEAKTVLNAQLQRCEFAVDSPAGNTECFEHAIRDYTHAKAQYHAAKATVEKSGGEAKMPAKRKALNSALDKCEFEVDNPQSATDCYQKAWEAHRK